MPVGAERGPQVEGWEPVSPRRHVSQRRRTADEQAERAAKAGTIFDIPGHPNSFAPLGEVDKSITEVSPDTKLHEEMGGKTSTYEEQSAQSRYFSPCKRGNINFPLKFMASVLRTQLVTTDCC